MKRIESALEKIEAADKIQESPWQEVVVRELNEISKDCANELQTETGQIGNKGDYQLGLDEWPPTRILSLMLVLSAWVGWIMHEKHGSSDEQPYNSVCSYAANPIRIRPIFMSIMLHHYKQLRKLSKEMNQKRAKRPI
jgi:hypothetical protein